MWLIASTYQSISFTMNCNCNLLVEITITLHKRELINKSDNSNRDTKRNALILSAGNIDSAIIIFQIYFAPNNVEYIMKNYTTMIESTFCIYCKF